jgi:hypothetical protein
MTRTFTIAGVNSGIDEAVGLIESGPINDRFLLQSARAEQDTHHFDQAFKSQNLPRNHLSVYPGPRGSNLFLKFGS